MTVRVNCLANNSHHGAAIVAGLAKTGLAAHDIDVLPAAMVARRDLMFTAIPDAVVTRYERLMHSDTVLLSVETDDELQAEWVRRLLREFDAHHIDLSLGLYAAAFHRPQSSGTVHSVW